MACCLGPPPRPCWRLPLIRSTWERSSVFWRCCIPGDKHCSPIRTSIASYLAEDCRLTIHGGSLAKSDRFARLLRDVSKIEWVVYAKRPFGGPEQVLKYLARYTHRVAISNQRLVALADGQVTFKWKDYADGNAVKEMTLSVTEFTRRFLLHILPRGFVRIRHYGLLANRCRRERLECCRKALQHGTTQVSLQGANEAENQSNTERQSPLCPVCRQGHMMIVERFEAQGTNHGSFLLACSPDSS